MYLSEAAEEAVIAASHAASPLETGGVLLGVRCDGRPWIVEGAVIAGLATSHSFLIPRGATRPVVEAARERDNRLGYLGDWHSHPENVGASSRDFRTLAYLALGAAFGPRLMAIVRHTDGGWRLAVWEQRKLRWPQECEVIRTGRLPSEGDGIASVLA